MESDWLFVVRNAVTKMRIQERVLRRKIKRGVSE